MKKKSILFKSDSPENNIIHSIFMQFNCISLGKKKFAKRLGAFLVSLVFFTTGSTKVNAQLFEQTFSSGPLTPSIISNTAATNPSTYVNSAAPNNGQFTFLSSNSLSTSISINSAAKLEIVKTTKNGYFMRNFPFPGLPTSLFFRFDFNVEVGIAVTGSTTFNVFIGDDISNSGSSPSAYHTNFRIVANPSNPLEWKVDGTVNTWVTGSHTIIVAVNNSGASLNYLAPNGSCESVLDDTYDIWVDTVLYSDNKVSLGASNTQGLSKFAITSNSGSSTTSTIDNILIDPIPPTPTVLPETPITGGGVGFNANWTPVSSVTGYYLDIADDNAYTTNLNTIYVSGAATSSYTFSSLTLGNTYYYRVRAASQYTIGTYQSCNSATESGFASSALSFSTQPQNISQCLGVSNILSVSSTQAISFQWYSNTINSNAGGTLIGGATGTTYTPSSAVAGTKYYYCLIGNATVQIASNVVTVRVDQSPTLTGVSQSSAVCGGQNATILLTGLVSGSVNKVYYHVGSGGALLADSVLETGGGNGSFLFMTTNANNGQNLVIDSIRSSCTSFFNNSVTLTVNTSPSNSAGGSTVTGCTVGNLTLSVSDPGAGFTTNWYAAATGGSVLSGVSGTNSYTTPSFSNDTSVTYYAQTFSATTGCSSPTRVAVNGSVTIPVFTLTNSTLYSPVPVSPYTVSLPYSFATSGLNQYSIAWTSANATTALFPPVNNGTLPASPVSIILNANAVAGQTYTGTITVRNSSTGCSTAAIPFTIVVLNIQVGDYGSVATGNWTATTTWKMYRSTTGRFDSTVTAAPTAATNIWIIDGYTVTANLGGSCKTIHVLNGSLISGTNVATNQNLSVAGTILEVAAGGYIGTTGVDDNADGISFSFNSANTTTTISGIGGRIDVSKFIIGGINANVVIDHDITVHFHGASNNGYGAALYANATGVNVTINAGRTLTMAKWASICNSSAPLTNSGSTSLKLNVNGVLSFLPGAPIGHSGAQQTFPSNSGFLCLNTTSTKADTLNIGATGMVNVTEFYPNGIVANGSIGTGNLSLLTVATNGVFNIDSVADFRNPLQTITGGGSFYLRGTALIRIGSLLGIPSTATGHIQTTTRNFSTTGRYSYDGIAAQFTGDGLPSFIGSLIINNTSNTSLTNDVTAIDSIRLTAGKLILGSKNAITAIVKNGSSATFVVTDGLGALKIKNVSNTDVFYPVGISTSAYNPVTINNIGTVDNFAVKVATGAPAGISSSPRLDSAINRNWSIVEDVQGGSNATVTLQWVPADANAGFLSNYCAVLHSNGTIIDNAGSVGPATGVNPYAKYGSGFTSFVSTDKFGVSTSPKKFRSRQSGLWNEIESWELYNASGSYSPSEADYPSVNPYDVIIQNTHTIATLSGTFPIVGNIQIDGLLSLLSDDISVYGNWNRSATGGFDHNNKTVKFVGATNSTIAANGAVEYFPYLTLSKSSSANTLSILDNVNIGKQLTVTSGALALGSKDITLQSNALNGTASFGAVGASGLLTYGTGRFIVERYISTGTGSGQHIKSWQFLATPTNGDNQTIKAAWQEGAILQSDNPNPGYGTQISGTGSGFDASSFLPSLKTYDATNNLWVGAGSTYNELYNKKGYMVFVRGDRGVSFGQAATPTKLRTRGKLFEPGNVAPVDTVPANSFQSVGNAYASPVDFSLLTKSNIDNVFYVWDPLLSGTSGFGGYQTLSSTNGYLPMPGGTVSYPLGKATKIIQSGQAFFVHNATLLNGTLSFSEAAKLVADSSRLVNRVPVNLNDIVKLTTYLLDVNSGSMNLLDGNSVVFDNAYINNVDENDAIKIFNPGENIGLSKNSQTLAVEARNELASSDTIFYYLSGLKQMNYQLKFVPQLLASSLLSAELIDNYLNTRTAVSLSDTTNFDFSVTSDLLSKDSGRFMLVFQRATTALPVTFVSITANRNQEHNISVNWSVENEINISHYEVERSNDSRTFDKIATQAVAINNGGSATYSYLDNNSFLSDNFYRVKAISQNGQIQYSKIVKVASGNKQPSISIYPNPATGGQINVLFGNQQPGICSIQLMNMQGQVLYEDKWLLNAADQRHIIKLGSKPATGVYQLRIAFASGETQVLSVNVK